MKKDKTVISLLAGVNLTELLVVVAVLAILTTIMSPVAVSYIKKVNEIADTSNARMIYTALQAASYNTPIKWPDGTTQYQSLEDGQSPDLLREYIGQTWPVPLQNGASQFTISVTARDGSVQSTAIYRIFELKIEQYDASSNQFVLVG